MANMKTTYNWLKQFAPFELAADKLAELLTGIGIEVEEMKAAAGGAAGIIVGLVEEVRPHPNADRLSLCRVNTGSKTVAVVCGAANVAAGQKIPLALPGTVLPGGFKIERRRIRGEDSEGMICSEAELGLSEEAKGILVLPTQSETGSAYSSSASSDVFLDLEITPNRPDLLSVRGLARDLCAALDLEFKPPQPAELGLELTARGVVPVEIADAALCARYAGLVIRGIKPGPSPAWLAQRLQSIGQRPISNIVDATNYALFELGHPLHAFDLAKLAGPSIQVRPATAGEKLQTIDGVEHQLSSTILVIADSKRPVALAGVMGGADTEVSDDTTDILLECAWFDPVSIRATCRALGLSSESSLRFSRNVDIEGIPLALTRTAEIILETAGGKIDKAVTDNYPRAWKQAHLKFSPRRCGRLLGMEIEPREMKRIITALGLSWKQGAEDAVELGVPSYRPDITRQADVNEELARIYGYDRLPPSLPRGALSAAPAPPPSKLRSWLAAHLVGLGFQEVILPSLDAGRGEDDALRILKPLSEEMAYLRRAPLPSLLALLAREARARPDGLRLFEFSRVFHGRKGKQPGQEEVLAGVCFGRRDLASWGGAKGRLDVFDIKGMVTGLAAGLNLPAISFRPGDAPPYLQPNSLISIHQADKEIGLLGEVHPAQTASFKRLRGQVFYFELYPWRLKLSSPRDISYRPFSRYPQVHRDIALLVPGDVPAEGVLDLIKQAGGKHLVSAHAFDFYRGDQVVKGNYSVAVHLAYQGADGTLTDEEVDHCYDEMVKRLERELGAKVRGAK